MNNTEIIFNIFIMKLKSDIKSEYKNIDNIDYLLDKIFKDIKKDDLKNFSIEKIDINKKIYISNSQEVKKLGHNPVFICDKGFEGVFSQYGFEEHHVNMSEPMSAEEMAKYWVDFINGHIPNFNKQPIDQIENYVKDS